MARLDRPTPYHEIRALTVSGNIESESGNLGVHHRRLSLASESQGQHEPIIGTSTTQLRGPGIIFSPTTTTPSLLVSPSPLTTTVTQWVTHTIVLGNDEGGGVGSSSIAPSARTHDPSFSPVSPEMTATPITIEVFTTETPVTMVVSTTVVPTTVCNISTNPGPPKSIIGGVIGAVLLTITTLLVILYCRRKRRHMYKAKASALINQATIPNERILTVIPSRLTRTRDFLRPHPFPDLLPSQPLKNAEPKVQEKPQLIGQSTQRNEEQNPFQDPGNNAVPEAQETEVDVASDVLDRLQGLTSQLEAGLQELSTLARSGRLSSEDRARLEEIRRTVALIIPYNQRRGDPSAITNVTDNSIPPSYHTNLQR